MHSHDFIPLRARGIRQHQCRMQQRLGGLLLLGVERRAGIGGRAAVVRRLSDVPEQQSDLELSHPRHLQLQEPETRTAPRAAEASVGWIFDDRVQRRCFHVVGFREPRRIATMATSSSVTA